MFQKLLLSRRSNFEISMAHCSILNRCTRLEFWQQNVVVAKCCQNSRRQSGCTRFTFEISSLTFRSFAKKKNQIFLINDRKIQIAIYISSLIENELAACWLIDLRFQRNKFLSCTSIMSHKVGQWIQQSPLAVVLNFSIETTNSSQVWICLNYFSKSKKGNSDFLFRFFWQKKLE